MQLRDDFVLVLHLPRCDCLLSLLGIPKTLLQLVLVLIDLLETRSVLFFVFLGHLLSEFPQLLINGRTLLLGGAFGSNIIIFIIISCLILSEVVHLCEIGHAILNETDLLISFGGAC